MAFRFKLGRRPARFDSRTLRMERYLTPSAPAPPEAIYWSKGFPKWGMMLNDDLGDCTIAGLGHATQTWYLNTGVNVNLGRVTPSDAVIKKGYEDFCGYNPADPNTDQGGVMLDVLNSYRQIGLGGDKPLAYAAVDVTNLTHVKQAIALFGGLYGGFNIPQSALDQNDVGQTWTVVPNDGGIAGGHAVWIPDFNPLTPICATWGMRQAMTWEFFLKYFDEGYAIFSPDWLISGKVSPSHIATADLWTDLTGVTN